MAGNGAIQFLRGTTDKISSSTETLLAGQPLIDTEKNLLYVGSGKAVNQTSPVNANLNIQAFWEGLKNNKVCVRAGDRSFVEVGGNMYPCTCLEATSTNGSTWQVNFDQQHRIAASSASSWGSTEMFTWLRDTILPSMPTYMQNCIEEVTKSGANSKLWLLAAEEIWGAANLPSYVVKDQNAHQFEYFKQLVGENASTSTNSKLVSNRSSWLRSGSSSSASYWYYLYYGGYLSSSSVIYGSDCAPFCFTVVS